MPAATARSELLIRRRLAALARTLPGARSGDTPSIHQARVATRRIREALPVIAHGSSAQELKRAVRRMTRALGPVRELDVALLMLDELASRDDLRGGVLYLQAAITQERARLHADMVHAIDPPRLEKLSRKLLSAARKRDARGADAGPTLPKHLLTARMRVARRAERLRARIENAAAIYLPDRLHEVRIAVKKLRYAMEIVRDLSGSRATKRIMMLKRAQDLLGRIHDLEVLIARTRAVQGSPSAPTLQLSADMDVLVRKLELECRQLHGRYIAMRPSLLAICDSAVSASAALRNSSSAA